MYEQWVAVGRTQLRACVCVGRLVRLVQDKHDTRLQRGLMQ